MHVLTVVIVVVALGVSVMVWLWTRRITCGLVPPTFTDMREALDLGARMQRQSRIRAELRGSGKAIEGKVVSIDDTGERWTNAPVLNLTVQLRDRHRTEVVIQEAVPMTVAARMKPGATVKVLTNPSDPAALALDWF